MSSMPTGFWGDTDGSLYRDSYFHAYPVILLITTRREGESRVPLERSGRASPCAPAQPRSSPLAVGTSGLIRP